MFEVFATKPILMCFDCSNGIVMFCTVGWTYACPIQEDVLIFQQYNDLLE